MRCQKTSPVPPHESVLAFTLLEMIIVIAIIGFMAAMALPHLGGFTKGNSMTVATQQLMDDLSLARQRALANRSEVCLVFLQPDFWTNDYPLNNFSNQQITTLVGHQYSGYALISMRTVGDQPGLSNVHYLTDWKFLPQGVFIAPYQLTNNYNGNQGTLAPPLTVAVTNGLNNSGLSISNGWVISAFTNDIRFPFPNTYSSNQNALPYIGFRPNGSLVAGSDQYIMLDSGSIPIPLDANNAPLWSPPTGNNTLPVETPPGNFTNNPNIIHIDWVTSRAKLEHNSF